MPAPASSSSISTRTVPSGCSVPTGMREKLVLPLLLLPPLKARRAQPAASRQRPPAPGVQPIKAVLLGAARSPSEQHMHRAR